MQIPKVLHPFLKQVGTRTREARRVKLKNLSPDATAFDNLMQLRLRTAATACLRSPNPCAD